MHESMATVLLEFTRLDEFGQHAEACPPGRERRESCERVGGERHAVIGADTFGQTVFLEQPAEHRFCPGHGRGRQRLTAQKITAEAVGDAQWVTVDAVGGLELPFEVGTPHVVGCEDRASGACRGG